MHLLPLCALNRHKTAISKTAKTKLKTQKNRLKRRFFCQSWSECGDSNPGPPAPKAGALPTAQHPDMKLWNCPGGFSQSKRATNCATPGYLFLAEKRNFAVPVKIPAEHGQGHRGMYAGGDMLTERFQYHSMEEKKKQGFPPADHSRLEKAGSANKKAVHIGR